MAGPRPQPRRHEPAAVRGIALERGELRIADRLEREPHHPDAERERVDQAEGGVRGPGDGPQWQRDDPRQRGLQAEHGKEAGVGECRGGAGAHGGVAWILGMAVVTAVDVPAEPQSPDRDQQRYTERARRGCPQRMESREQREAGAPEPIDQADVAGTQAHEPHRREQRERDHSGLREWMQRARHDVLGVSRAWVTPQSRPPWRPNSSAHAMWNTRQRSSAREASCTPAASASTARRPP